jgi:hypothetical protein
MALTQEEIDYLTRPDKIRTCHLSQEARAFREKYMRGIYKENRLQRQYDKRKAELDGIEVIDYTFVDWKSEEEFWDWFNKDRIERRKILDAVLTDPNWLEILAKKYYGEDGWQVVYADKTNGGKNWAREDIKKEKKKLNKDVEED